jgi:uncharacterized protein with HEPN domain
MSRHDRQRLTDITTAIDAIRAHLLRGDLSDGLVFDAVRVRLIEIGEAAKSLSAELLAHEPTIPWSQIAGLRDRLAHRYFDTSHAILAATITHDLPELEAAGSLLARGLTGVKLITSDAHASLVAAIGATQPGAGWQQCRTHDAVNLMSVTPKSSWPWVRTLVAQRLRPTHAASGHAQYDRVLDTLTEQLPRTAEQPAQTLPRPRHPHPLTRRPHPRHERGDQHDDNRSPHGLTCNHRITRWHRHLPRP